MTEDVQLAALAVIELTARQIVDPERTQLHSDELAVSLRDVDPVMVALEVATVLAGVAVGTGFPLGQLIEAKRARLLASLTGTDATSTVLRLRKTRTVQSVVIDPHSPGATLIKPLTDAEVHVTQPSTSDMAVAHGTFLDELAAGRLRHAGQPELDTAVRHGAQRPLGGATGVAATRHASRPLTAVRGDISRLGLLYGAAEYDVLESAW